ncbi:hypothetical protein [Sphingobium xenophagum]|uniref:hypothetical protein n=1 Tax=Sphingobium xenophagum TaxID=121428 RepID=UPI00241E8E33|nr:hypothetical protein [Sphingobium xenophagum]
MSRGFLKPMAIGAALSAVSCCGAWAVQQLRASKEWLILEYRRPTGQGPAWQKAGDVDPARQARDVSAHLTFIASRCRLAEWQMSSNIGWLDVDETAQLRFPTKGLNDASFSCVLSFVKPPFVRLHRESQK